MNAALIVIDVQQGFLDPSWGPRNQGHATAPAETREYESGNVSRYAAGTYVVTTILQASLNRLLGCGRAYRVSGWSNGSSQSAPPWPRAPRA